MLPVGFSIQENQLVERPNPAQVRIPWGVRAGPLDPPGHGGREQVAERLAVGGGRPGLGGGPLRRPALL